jgi:hypothetical protein
MTKIKPILVTGSFRSGTTWAGRMIGFSDKVKYIGEPFNTINGSLYGLDFKNQFYKIENENTEEYYEKVKNAIGLSFNFTDLKRRMKSSTDTKHMAIALARYFLFKRNKLSNIRPLIKDPMALMSADWLYKTFQTQNIVLIRHPAAFIYSLDRMKWGLDFKEFLNQPALMKTLDEFRDEIIYFSKKTYDADRIKAGILVWNSFHKIILDYKNLYPSWMFFTHEELSKDPKTNFAKIYKNLNLNFDDKIIKKIDAYTNNENPVEAAESEAFSLNRNSKENIKTWKQKLKEEDVKQIFEGTKKISSNFYSENDW